MSFKKKVLIIDDEADFCFLLKTYLSKKNYKISLANTLKQGMQLLESEIPDIIFLDNNLPDGFGWDKIDFITTAYPDAELNLMSAYKYTYPVARAENVKLWEKPLDLRKLDQYL
ncbi:MAG: response regulator [Bacteroidota bacterium]